MFRLVCILFVLAATLVNVQGVMFAVWNTEHCLDDETHKPPYRAVAPDHECNSLDDKGKLIDGPINCVRISSFDSTRCKIYRDEKCAGDFVEVVGAGPEDAPDSAKTIKRPFKDWVKEGNGFKAFNCTDGPNS